LAGAQNLTWESLDYTGAGLVTD